MANRRMLQDIMSMYMQQRMASQRAEEAHKYQLAEQENQGRIQAQNQGAARDAQGEIGLLTRLMSSNDPQLVDRLMKSGREQLAGQPLAPFAVGGDSFDPQMKQITEAKTPQDLPSSEALYRQNLAGRTNAPIKDLYGLTSMLNARQSQEQSLKAGAAPVKISYPDDKGNMMDEYRNPWDIQDQPYYTEPTAQQAGTKKGEEIVAQDKVAGPTQTARAGATARAVGAGGEAGRLGVYHSQLYTKARLDEFTQRGVAEAAQRKDLEAAKSAQEAAKNAGTATLMLDQLQGLYDKVKPTSAWQGLWRKGQDKIGMLQETNPQAAELNRLAAGYAMGLYRAYGGSSANVSDKDTAAMQGLIPDASTVAAVGDAIYEKARITLTFAPLLAARYPMSGFEQRIAMAKRWAEQAAMARKAGATSFEDPFSPGSTPIPLR